MSTSVCYFRIRWTGAINEGDQPRIESTTSQSGIIRRRIVDSTARYVMPNARIVLKGDSGHTYDDWRTWYKNTALWGAESVLIKPHLATLYVVSDESIGTVSGAAETFALDSKFVHHTDFSETATTLVVKVAGVVQTLTTDYTVSGNGTAPIITSTASMDTGAATASYERYFQCYIEQTGEPTVRRPGQGDNAKDVVEVPVSIMERQPGGHLA